jgi:dTDP-D-glucose 4,6-dehydratase
MMTPLGFTQRMFLRHRDISKAKKLLCWQPEVNIEEGIQKTVAWYLENQEWVKNV